MPGACDTLVTVVSMLVVAAGILGVTWVLAAAIWHWYIKH
jgi:hypothetical protein